MTNKSAKILTYIIFATISIVLCAYIISQHKHIQSDIYELLELDISQIDAIQSIQSNLTDNVAFLSDDFALLERVVALNERYDIFSEIKINADKNTQDYLADIKKMRLATLDRTTYEQITNDAEMFVERQINDMFNNFTFRPFSISDDFFNLAGHSGIFNINNNIKLDLSNSRFYIENNDKIFYFGVATLRDNADSGALLALINDIRDESNKTNKTFLASSGAIFAAVAKDEGNKESIYMGTLSVVLVGILLLFAFGSWHIFKLVAIIIFSFLCGLGGTFIALGEIHLLSIVISTSLVGLILDFAMHYLGHKQNKSITPKSITEMKKVFVAGLVITCSGYALFLISPMKFLHQIAVISIFALIGAFLSTYFLLPQMFSGKVFHSNRIFRIFIIWCVKLLKMILKYKKILLCCCTIIVICAITKINPNMLNDNIKNYSAMPQYLLDETIAFGELSRQNLGTRFVVIDSKYTNDILTTEQNLIRDLLQNKLINDFDGLSKVFLSTTQQERLKRAFKQMSQNPEIMSRYNNIGFDKNNICDEFTRIISTPTLNLGALLDSDIGKEFARFIVKNDDDTYKSLVFMDNPIINQSFMEILTRYNAEFVDFTQMINDSFTHIKNNAIMLKIGAYVLAFGILAIFFGIKTSSMITGIVLFGTMISIAILIMLGVELNIFVIFGLILASAVGIDYAILAINDKLTLYSKIFGILLANLTSLISFSLLILSSTNAVSSFGLSASMCMGFCALLSLLLAVWYSKTNK